MSMVLWNPTDEEMTYFHGGVTYRFDPGAKIKVGDRAGNHLLTHLHPRGLINLDFGDENKIEDIEAEALERNREFKLKQVIRYNELNNNRKQTAREFLPPSKQVKKYAEQLGVELVQPFAIKDAQQTALNVANERAAEAERRADNMDKEISELKQMLNTLISAINEEGDLEEEDTPKKTRKKSTKKDE